MKQFTINNNQYALKTEFINRSKSGLTHYVRLLLVNFTTLRITNVSCFAREFGYRYSDKHNAVIVKEERYPAEYLLQSLDAIVSALQSRDLIVCDKSTPLSTEQA